MTAELPSMRGRNHQTPRSRTKPGRLPWILVLAGVIVYSNSFSGPFVFDDIVHIVEDPSIETLWPPWQVLARKRQRIGPRPITKISLAVNRAMNRTLRDKSPQNAQGKTRLEDVTVFHLTNVIIHILAALLFFGILRRTLYMESWRNRFASSGCWLAFATALLWLVHPIQTQAVTYVIQRAESLMGLCLFLTLYSAIRCAQGVHPVLWGALAVLVCVIGMGTKEVMAVAPLMTLFYDRTFLAGSFIAALKKRKWLYLGLAGSWCVLLAIMGPFRPFRGETMGFGIESITPLKYLITQPQVILHYLRLSIWPNPLCLDYAWLGEDSTLEIMLSGMLVGVLLMTALWTFWRLPWFGFLWICFFLILSPTSSIIPINDLAFEHRMYLPSAVIITLLVLLVAHLLEFFDKLRSGIATSLLVITTVVLSYATINRNQDYQRTDFLWRSVVEIAPHNSRGHNNLANALHPLGQSEQAVIHYRQALDIDPEYARAHSNLGTVLVTQNKLQEAIAHHRRAVDLTPQDGIVHANFALALAATGERQLAIKHFQKALKICPDLAKPHTRLGVLLGIQGDLKRAEYHHRKSIELSPDFLDAHNNLGIVLLITGRSKEAIQHLSIALSLNPEDPQTNNNLGNALQLNGRLDEAIGYFRKALQLDPQLIQAYVNLGMLYAAQGDLEKAIPIFRQASRLQPDSIDIQVNLGVALASSGQLNQAAALFRQAMKHAPNDARIHVNVGNMLRLAGQWDEAEHQFRQALQKGPNFPDTHINLGNLLELLGRRGEARNHQGQVTQPHNNQAPAWQPGSP